MSEISNQLENLSYKAQALADQANQLASTVVETSGGHSDFLIFGITVLVLACFVGYYVCLLYTSPSPRDATLSRMPSSA